jgi:large subunit ribosomal protein L24
MKIRKNDTIKMMAGKDSGKTGKVLKVMAGDGKVVVEGLNMMKKHTRPRREGEKGQRIEIPRAVDISNVIMVCPKCGKTVRVGYKMAGDEKSRICKKCGQDI